MALPPLPPKHRPRSHPALNRGGWLQASDFPAPKRPVCSSCGDSKCGGPTDSQSDCFDPIVTFGPAPEWVGQPRPERRVRPRIDPVPSKT